MKLDAGRPLHLTYCTNIHAGESWPEVQDSLRTYLLPIRRAVAPGRPFGVGLRLSAIASEALAEPAELERFRAFLAEHDLYVFTINGFPYGTFHGARVKENVYLPDWLDPARVEYSDRLAALLAALLPDQAGLEGSVSTVPGAFKARASGPDDAARIAEHLLQHAVTLHRLRERTGKRISLALEPEPACQLETVAETIDFFERYVFGSGARARFAALSGLAPPSAEAFLREHLGVCFDACHMAVEFEHPVQAVEAITRAGVRIPKFQISAGLEVAFTGGPADRELTEALGAFADDVYLHQVVERRAEGLRRFVDLPDALRDSEAGARAWRIHYHVPIFRDRLGIFANTQHDLEVLLARIRSGSPGAHLEVETYCWDVIPAEHKLGGVVENVTRELEWVLARVGG